MLGQLPRVPGGEHFGALFQKGNPLVGCVNKAIARLKANGTLKTLERIWLRKATGAPEPDVARAGRAPTRGSSS